MARIPLLTIATLLVAAPLSAQSSQNAAPPSNDPQADSAVKADKGKADRNTKKKNELKPRTPANGIQAQDDKDDEDQPWETEFLVTKPATPAPAAPANATPAPVQPDSTPAVDPAPVGGVPFFPLPREQALGH